MLDTTFTNYPVGFEDPLGNEMSQSYPGRYSVDNYAPLTGADEIVDFGFDTHWLNDSVYNISFIIDHNADSIDFNFISNQTLWLSDESWGLDNVTVEVVPEPCSLALLGLGGLLLKRRK